MTDLLYDRMSRRIKIAIVFSILTIYLSVVGAIIYVIVHFVLKFW